MCNRIIPLLIAFQCAAILTPPAAAQKAMETVTKTATRDIQLSPGDVFRVVAEKANIKITGWDKKHIRAQIAFSASHPDKKIAAGELAFMQYAISREANAVEFINAFVLPANTDVIHSKLEVTLEFMVPSAAFIELEARYGNAAISNVAGVTDIDLEFSDLDLRGVSGKLALHANFSEIRGDALRLSSFKSQDAKSQFLLELTGGSYSFHSKYSKLDLTVNGIEDLTINAERTDVMVRTETLSAYRYDLISSSGKVYIPAVFEPYARSGNRQNTVRTPGGEGLPLIRIKTTFDTITIK